MLGTLYGISAGPGDPELITLKGVRILQNAPVVAFPEGLRGNPGIAERIIAQWLRPEKTQLPLKFPYVRDEAVLAQAWHEASDRVWSHLAAGEDVAFVSEGDVSFYSTFTYLAQTLQQTHPEAMVQAVPGVSSPMAAAAELGIPLVTRNRRLLVLPTLYAVEDLERALDSAEVVVLMKFGSVYERVWQVLQRRDLLDRCWIVERATHPDRKIYTDLRDRPQLDLSYFSVAIVWVVPPGNIESC